MGVVVCGGRGVIRVKMKESQHWEVMEMLSRFMNVEGKQTWKVIRGRSTALLYECCVCGRGGRCGVVRMKRVLVFV